MDITKLSPEISQSNVLSALNISMLSKTIDLAQVQTDMISESIAMSTPSLESLVNPSTMGTSIDIQV